MTLVNGWAVISIVLLLAHLAAANVEKAIFLGPAPVNIPLQQPTLTDLNLRTLTPEDNSVRTELSRALSKESPEPPPGHATWLILDHLTEGQRYELRVCWAAIVRLSL